MMNVTRPALAPIAVVPGASPPVGIATTHESRVAPATDGTEVAFRTTQAAGDPRGVLVFVTGTDMPMTTFDLPGDQLAARGIASYAVQSRTSAPTTRQHSDDVDSVLALARAEHPDTPLAIGGVSLGADIALYNNVLHGKDGGRPTIAVAPVFIDKYLSIGDHAKIVGGLVSDKLAATTVDTPMSAHKTLTNNESSSEFHVDNPDSLRVPASLFDDVFRMAGHIALHGRRTSAPLLVAMAGADQVNLNFASKAVTKLVGSADRTTLTVDGAEHDLPQEHAPGFFDAVAGFVATKGTTA